MFLSLLGHIIRGTLSRVKCLEVSEDEKYIELCRVPKYYIYSEKRGIFLPFICEFMDVRRHLKRNTLLSVEKLKQIFNIGE